MLSRESFRDLVITTKGFIFDIEGTLTHDGKMIPGIIALIEAIREKGCQIRLLTNMTGRMPAALAEDLRALGLDIDPHEIKTSVTTAITYLQTQQSGKRGYFAIPDNIKS